LSLLDPNNDRGGLVTIHESATLVSPLVGNARLIAEDAYAQAHVLGTKLKPAIDLAQYEFAQNGRTDALKVMVLLTDGDVVPDSDANGNYIQQAIDSAAAARAANIRVVALGYQSGVLDAGLLQSLVSASSDYYEALSPDQIRSRFRGVARDF